MSSRADKLNMATREQKKLIKECLHEVLDDEIFVQRLTKKLLVGLEKSFTDKLALYEKQIENLEAENTSLKAKCDDLEQYSRRSNLRIHGVPVSSSSTEESVIQIIHEKLNIQLEPEAIDSCHPVGQARDGKQSIIIKFVSYRSKRRVMQQRGKLKGTDIRIVEDLTRARHALFQKAVKKFGFRNVWQLDGTINVKVKDVKHVIRSEADLEKFVG